VAQVWVQQFDETTNLFLLLTNIHCYNAIVVLLRCMSHADTARRLRSQIMQIAMHYVIHYNT
jgi:hypothetical protein